MLIAVFLFLALLLTLNRYFCFCFSSFVNVEQVFLFSPWKKYFYRIFISFPFFIVERMGMCIADNTDHPLLCCLFRFTLLLPVTRCSGHNTNLPSNNNILKIVTVNIAFTKAFFLKKNYWISFLIMSRLIDYALVVHGLSNYWNLKNQVFQFFRYWKG